MISFSQEFAALVLAAGRGSRMQSSLPKVLHAFQGRPMLAHVLETLGAVGAARSVCVLSQDVDPFKDFLLDFSQVNVVTQGVPNGTGGAVAAASVAFDTEPLLFGEGRLLRGEQGCEPYVLICLGDVPALDRSLLKAFCDQALQQAWPLGVLALQLENPTGYGRLLLNQEGRCLAVVEERDASSAQQLTTLCNTGIIWAQTSFLFKLLAKLGCRQSATQNAAGEYYLTSLFALAAEACQPAHVFVAPEDKAQCFFGVNTPCDLLELESRMRAPWRA